ncbi:hypothetical protein KZC51_04470 [Microbacterium sp. SSW1-49]|uniref:LXG domain-containing protein n=1 Tax=Microbacterium croceum TaxID=2851645 RepID=A0ABT0FBE4_9MICO|nr:hypothetical protein [Microbacterium croceum]MCK2035385.1 hypothetical protein [Microbacterium croceum]
MTLFSPRRGYPLERITGDVGTMSRWVDQFTMLAEHLRALRGASARATGLPGMGRAVTAVRADALDILTTIGSHIALAQTVSSVLSAYARSHDEHARRANALIEQIESAHAACAQLGAASDQAGRRARAASEGDDPVAAQLAEDAASDIVSEHRRAEDDLDELWTRYEFHFQAWDEAYDAGVRALVGETGALSTPEARDLLDEMLSADSPAAVLALWLAHPELQEELIAAHPEMLGAMDGIPAAARVRANQANAEVWIEAAEAERAAEPEGSERSAFLAKEIAYLRQVLDGSVQLYLYDRVFSRIVEVIGDLSQVPQRVLTYVPGTFTSFGDFYAGQVQQVAASMVEKVPGTLAFVYKDGLFPGENPEVGGVDPLRIVEANDQQRAAEAGRQLARFEAGMRADPQLAVAEQDAFGHSWGLANVTSAEVAGADFDKVVSLSGAGMLPEWTPDPGTVYTDLSYRDILQAGQDLGVVWDGNTPRSDPVFDHDDYYVGPNDEVLDRADNGSLGRPTINIPKDYFAVLTENHNLIATDDPANERALRQMRKLVSE